MRHVISGIGQAGTSGGGLVASAEEVGSGTARFVGGTCSAPNQAVAITNFTKTLVSFFFSGKLFCDIFLI